MRPVAIAMVVLAACSGGAKERGDGMTTTTKPVTPTSAPAPVAMKESWAATLVLPTEMRDLVINFEHTGDAWTATLDVPALQKTGIPLSDVAVTDASIKFTFAKPGLPQQAWEVYELARTGDAAKGTGLIGGMKFAIAMAKLAPGEVPHSLVNRPSTPKPPFPYESREVTVDAPDGGKLAGTMTIPQGTGPFPAMLLLSGSGQQDRDETIFGHKTYLIVSDRLTRAGFVTLRLDDRGVGKTVGAVGTLDTEIADGTADVAFLKSQKEVDPKRIGVMGHSTGGMVAPNVAVKTHGVAFIVSLAGPSVAGVDLVPLQMEAGGRAGGLPEWQAKVDIQKKVGPAYLKGPDALRAAVSDIAAAQLGRAPTKDELDQAMKQFPAALDPWTLSFFKLDPAVAWKQLKIPVLLIVGDKDTQVPADVNIQALQKAVGDPKLLVTKKMPGLNHLFQQAQTGLVDEYGAIETSIDDSALDQIVGWLKTTAKIK